MKNVLELESVIPSIGMQKPIKMHGRLWSKYRIIIPHVLGCNVLGCKQALWIGTHKICLYVVSNEEMTSFIPRKTSSKAMVKTMAKDTWSWCWVVYGITKAHSYLLFLQK